MKETMPYGYKRVNGDIVIDRDKAEQICKLFRSYNRGSSVPAALYESGVERSTGWARHALANRSYAGDDGFPAIISRGLFESTQQEIARRAEPLIGKIGLKSIPVVPVYKNFWMDETMVPKTAVEKYRAIKTRPQNDI